MTIEGMNEKLNLILENQIHILDALKGVEPNTWRLNRQIRKTQELLDSNRGELNEDDS